MTYSDEDTDVKALVTSWLNKHEEKEREMLTGWIEDYFYKALEWVLRQVTYLETCFYKALKIVFINT